MSVFSRVVRGGWERVPKAPLPAFVHSDPLELRLELLDFEILARSPAFKKLVTA